jgi:hypothetical protein
MGKAETIVLKPEGHKCVYNEWFVYASKCPVKTCKNHNTITATGCLARDRVVPEGNKVISDEEVRLYKYNGQKISTRLVSTHRKDACDSVRRLLVLYAFMQFILENRKPVKFESNETLSKMELDYPICELKDLGWNSYMWHYLLDGKTWNKFTNGNVDVTLDKVLSLDQSFLTKLSKTST